MGIFFFPGARVRNNGLGVNKKWLWEAVTKNGTFEDRYAIE